MKLFFFAATLAFFSSSAHGADCTVWNYEPSDEGGKAIVCDGHMEDSSATWDEVYKFFGTKEKVYTYRVDRQYAPLVQMTSKNETSFIDFPTKGTSTRYVSKPTGTWYAANRNDSNYEVMDKDGKEIVGFSNCDSSVTGLARITCVTTPLRMSSDFSLKFMREAFELVSRIEYFEQNAEVKDEQVQFIKDNYNRLLPLVSKLNDPVLRRTVDPLTRDHARSNLIKAQRIIYAHQAEKGEGAAQ